MRIGFMALLGLIGVGGCGGGGAAGPTAPDAQVSFASLDLTPASVAVPVGGTVQLVATPRDSNGNPVGSLPPATFSSSSPETAGVDDQGLVTGNLVGSAVITASVTASGVTHTASATVAVTSGERAPATVTTPGLAFDPASLAVSVGDTVTWEFSGAVHNVTFTEGTPPGGNIPDQQIGSVVEREFPDPGTFKYECTIHAGMAGEVVVTTGTPSVFTSLAVTPTTPAMDIGQSVQLTVTALDQFGNAMPGMPAPTFSVIDGSIASVDAGGLVTGVSEGTTTVVASITHDGVTQTASATVNVRSPQSGAVTVTTPNLRFDPPTISIPVGGSVTWQFSEAVHNVTFSGAAPSGGSIPDQDPGNAVSRSFTAAGTYGYECTRHSGMVGEVVVEGGAGPSVFSSLALSPMEWAMPLGAFKELTATPLDQNGLPISGLPAPSFTSSDPAVAFVDESGLVTTGGEGTVVVTAALTVDGETRTATTSISVAPATAAVVRITADLYEPDPVDIAPGGTVIWEVGGSAHNMTFDLPPVEGNIPDTDPGNAVARTFATENDYDYECTLHGEKGRVRVR